MTSTRSCARRGAARAVVAAATGAVLVLGTAAAGVTAWAAGVGGRGVEPEAVAPASSIAFVRLDLNPSLRQKLDIVRFARTVSAAERTAGVHRTGPTPHTFAAVRNDLLDAVLGAVPGPVQLHAWVAGRAAVAAYPDRAAPGGIAEVGIVQYDDDGAMRRALAYRARSGQVGYAVDTADSYVVLASSTTVARRALAAARAHPLAADPTFRGDVASLPQHDDPALVWADVTAADRELLAGPTGTAGSAVARTVLDGPAGAVLRTLPTVTAAAPGATTAGRARSSAPTTGSVSGDERLVIGLRIEPTAVDVQGRLRNAPAARTAAPGHGVALAGLDRVPTDALAALSVAGLGPLLGDGYPAAGTGGAGGRQARSELRRVGIGSAGDLRVLFGSVTTAAVLAGRHPVVTATASSPHPARGLAVARRVLARLGARRDQVSLRTADGAVLLQTPAGSRPPTGSGKLGSSALFRAAVPDAGQAGAIGFLDVHRAVAADTGLSPVDRAELSPITAVGFASHGGAGAGFRLRLTIR